MQMTTATHTDRLQGYRESYSDFYKDVHGFRPRMDTSAWTLEQWEAEWECLHRMLKINEEDEAARQAEAIKDFEDRVTKCIKMGAADRATAIRWIASSSDIGQQFDGDLDYLCYSLHLPYGYLTERTESDAEADAADRKSSVKYGF